MERARPGLARANRARWAAVGRSAHLDPASAGTEAARCALAGGTDAGLLLLFVSGNLDLDAVTAAAAAVAGDVVVAGCSSTGEITAAGSDVDSVVAIALGGEGLTFSTTAVRDMAPREAGAAAAACLGDLDDRPHRVLLLLADALVDDHAEIARGAYSVSGAAVPIVGGVAGCPIGRPDGRYAVLHGDRALSGAVVGVAIGSDAPLGVAARHGWTPVGEPMLVTRAADGRVFELDDRPAADVYLERLGAQPEGPVWLANPMGIQRRAGEAAIRSVWRDDATDGSLCCRLESGALVWPMTATREGVIAAADTACREALAKLDGGEARALLVFSCAGRADFLGGVQGGATDEIARIAELAGDAVVAGAYTHGEFARTSGSVGFHHQTAVVLAVA